jgi:hypothetical protein
MKRKLNRTSFCFAAFCILMIFISNGVKAQYFDSDSAFRAGKPNSGRIWGYVFGDYYHKSHSDSLNRGGNNQYTGVKKGQDEFQFRRIYLGYDYNISKQFSAEFLLAAEDDFTGGDLLTNTKFTPYIKFANLRWKNFLFKGNDLLFGLQPTPSFPYMSEYIFSYSRPIERTITDIRRTPSFDFGLGMQGRFNSADNSMVYGYNLLVANGSSAKPQAVGGNLYKWFYGDAFIGFLHSKLIFDFYADYQRQNWIPGDHGHSSRQMTKGVIAWVDKKFTIGMEGYTNGLKQADVGINGAVKDTLDGRATGLTLYGHVSIIKTKLRLWCRFDFYNPNTQYDNSTYTKYAALYTVSTTYEPNNKERFLSVGLDISPTNNVHIMPNIWYDRYVGQGANLVGSAAHDYDLVYRVTFYFTFGKLFPNPIYSYHPFVH